MDDIDMLDMEPLDPIDDFFDILEDMEDFFIIPQVTTDLYDFMDILLDILLDIFDEGRSREGGLATGDVGVGGKKIGFVFSPPGEVGCGALGAGGVAAGLAAGEGNVGCMFDGLEGVG